MILDTEPPEQGELYDDNLGFSNYYSDCRPLPEKKPTSKKLKNCSVESTE